MDHIVKVASWFSKYPLFPLKHLLRSLSMVSSQFYRGRKKTTCKMSWVIKWREHGLNPSIPSKKTRAFLCRYLESGVESSKYTMWLYHFFFPFNSEKKKRREVKLAFSGSLDRRKFPRSRILHSENQYLHSCSKQSTILLLCIIKTFF